MLVTTPEEAIYTQLSTTIAVTTLATGGIFPTLPTGEPAFPLVVYQRVGKTGQPKLNGAVTLAEYSIKVDVYSESSESQAQTLGLAVHDCLVPPGGTWINPANGVLGVFDGDSSSDITEDQVRVSSWTFRVFWKVPGT